MSLFQILMFVASGFYLAAVVSNNNREGLILVGLMINLVALGIFVGGLL